MLVITSNQISISNKNEALNLVQQILINIPHSMLFSVPVDYEIVILVSQIEFEYLRDLCTS